MLVSCRGPLSDLLSKHDEEECKHGDSKAQAANENESILEPHAFDPRLDTEGNSEADDVPDQNDGSHDLSIDLFVRIENVTHGHCAADTETKSDETHAHDRSDPVQTMSSSSAIYYQTSWHDKGARNKCPETILWLSPASITVAEVHSEPIVQRA